MQVVELIISDGNLLMNKKKILKERNETSLLYKYINEKKKHRIVRIIHTIYIFTKKKMKTM